MPNQRDFAHSNAIPIYFIGEKKLRFNLNEEMFKLEAPTKFFDEK